MKYENRVYIYPLSGLYFIGVLFESICYLCYLSIILFLVSHMRISHDLIHFYIDVF